MNFWTTIVGLVRRKRVIIPAIVVAVVLGGAAYLITPVRYVSETLTVLTPTEFGGTESQDPASPTELTNPMLNFNESLKTTSAILIQAMNSTDIEEQLGATGDTTLVVDDGRTNPDLLGVNGPFLYVVGRSSSPDDAKRVVAEAEALMREKLQGLQRTLRAPERTFVSIVEVVPPSVPEPDRARATKMGFIAFIFGFGLSMGLAYFVHRRRARRHARSNAQAAGTSAWPFDDRADRELGPHPTSLSVAVPGIPENRHENDQEARPDREDDDELVVVAAAPNRASSVLAAPKNGKSLPAAPKNGKSLPVAQNGKTVPAAPKNGKPVRANPIRLRSTLAAANKVRPARSLPNKSRARDR